MLLHFVNTPMYGYAYRFTHVKHFFIMKNALFILFVLPTYRLDLFIRILLSVHKLFEKLNDLGIYTMRLKFSNFQLISKL